MWGATWAYMRQKACERAALMATWMFPFLEFYFEVVNSGDKSSDVRI